MRIDAVWDFSSVAVYHYGRGRMLLWGQAVVSTSQCTKCNLLTVLPRPPQPHFFVLSRGCDWSIGFKVFWMTVGNLLAMNSLLLKVRQLLLNDSLFWLTFTVFGGPWRFQGVEWEALLSQAWPGRIPFEFSQNSEWMNEFLGPQDLSRVTNGVTSGLALSVVHFSCILHWQCIHWWGSLSIQLCC